MTVIIDYRTGNLNSIKNILKRIGHNTVVSNDKNVIEDATKLILPGVGHFDHGMKNLEELGLIPLLNKKVLEQKTPVLGICLGVQLLTKGSEEGNLPGLGWIDGYTRAFDKSKLSAGLKIPHMGWSDVSFRENSRLFKGYTETPRFYFVHSFHLVCNNQADELTHCNYGYDFVAGVERDNIMGVQFHPEKSHKFGMRFLENFMNHY